MKILTTSVVAALMITMGIAQTADAKKVPVGSTATVLVGQKAKPLMRALKLAGVKATKKKNVWTWKLPSLSCHSASETEDGLGTYDCEAGKQKIANAAAAYLMDAMGTAGIQSDDGMSQSRMKVTDLTCIDDQSASGGADAMYSCTFVPFTP